MKRSLIVNANFNRYIERKLVPFFDVRIII